MKKTIKFGDIFSINKEGRKNEKRYIFCGKAEGKLLLYLLDGSGYILVDKEWFRDKQMHYIEDIEQPDKGHNDRELDNSFRVGGALCKSV